MSTTLHSPMRTITPPIRAVARLTLVVAAALALSRPAKPALAMLHDDTPAADAANPTPPAISERNAALDLWRVWDVIGHDTLGNVHEAFDSNPAWTPDEELQRTLRSNEDAIESLAAAMRVPLCDFQPRLEEGVGALLPHLAKMRSTTMLLAADARRRTALGEHDKAAERIEAIVRLAGHTSSDRVLISSLVGVAVVGVARSELERLSNLGALTDAGRDGIRAALDSAPGLEPDDPLRFLASLRTERDWMLRSIKDTLRSDDADDLLAMLGTSGLTSSMMRAMSDAAIDAEIRRSTETYNQLIEAWQQPDAPAKLAEVEEQVSSRRAGLFASLFIPAATKAYVASMRGVESLDAMRTIVNKPSPTRP